MDLGEYVILEIVTYFNEVNLDKKNENLETDIIELKKLFGFSFNLDVQKIKKIPPLLLFSFLREQFWLTYDIKETNLIPYHLVLNNIDPFLIPLDK